MTDLTRWWPLTGYTELRDALLAAWSSPSRQYHDVRHLAEVLQHLDRLTTDLADADPDHPAPDGVDLRAVTLAAWFHDAVHDAGPDCEERSAQWALRALGPQDAGGPAPEDGSTGLAREVARLVRLTAHHHPAPDDLAGGLLCDADLAILAAGPDRYADYVAGVRAEYAHLDDVTFAAGRTAVLEQLLAAEHLYATARGRTRWEARARANVRAELVSLARVVSGGADRPHGAG